MDETSLTPIEREALAVVRRRQRWDEVGRLVRDLVMVPVLLTAGVLGVLAMHWLMHP
jgi:hypothetical protein